jgi:GR25 family glycosyltransferase involved in LPS biosynthesis
MNIIVISLEKAKERREKIKTQLASLNIDAIIMDAIDGALLSEEQKNKKIYLQGGYRFGDTFKPGEIACTMSHINAIKIAKEKSWPYFIVLEDDVYLAEDFVKRFKFLLKIVPANWEHVYLSGIPKIGLNAPPNLQFCNVVPTVFTECTHSMLIRDIAYDKIINKLSLFETTTDDMYNHMIFSKNLISYTYYPFITYADDDYTYIWNHELKREHKSKQYFRNSI